MTAIPIYLDNNATTRTDPRVVEAMLPYFTEIYGNAASAAHSYGWRAEEAVEKARISVAKLIGADPREIVFTSGATESDNLALRGIAESYKQRKNHIITTTIEHKAILDTAHKLEQQGYTVTYIPVDKMGRVDINQIVDTIRPETVLISIIMANNEIGTIQDIGEIGKICRERGVHFHTDATQAAGKLAIDVQSMNIDLLSYSAHKMHGPKGIGALYIRKKSPRILLAPQITGGGQETGMRSGTLNTPGIVGFGAAADISFDSMGSEIERLTILRDRFIEKLLAIEGASLNGHPALRLCNNINVTFKDAEADAIMANCHELAFSTSSACSSSSIAMSYVLKAIGLTDREASCTIRLGISRFTTEQEIDYAVSRITEAVKNARNHPLGGCSNV